MTDELPIVICLPVSSGPPAAPSNMNHCHHCGVAVWVSKNLTEDYQHAVCLTCFFEHVQPGDQVTPSPAVARDLLMLMDEEDMVHE